ncbi:plasmid mobilization protein [Propionivibrio soli]|uniref:plasmid mobilization protein n=1 Tax=Propionivibrio soli TaxID=2976531 RepID=UPI0021E92CC5|nr:hypothetical protein [Propionivibrio soli]
MSTRSESRQKTKLIQVRATPEEKERLRARASAFGISMGELCRQTILAATPRSTTDQAAIAELAATRADLGRLGGLLKGWLSGAFEKPVPPLHARGEIVVLLREIDATQAVIKETAKKVAR